ncbi:oxidoreductase [Patescibacteria group bacterium]|nr:MAG: oxidoreductase [Patescibacteria group bacterium]
MKNNRLKLLVFVLIPILVLLGFWLVKQRAPKIKNLDAVEVQSYQGKDLSSINDFRENSIKGPQYVDRASYRLNIKGLTDGEKNLTYDEVVRNHSAYQKVVTLNCVEGWSVTILWEGLLVRDLVDTSKIPTDANTIIFRAADGYSTSFPLDYILQKDILMAYKMNGATLPPERGFPFQLVAEDKYGYKWIKWITEIEFSNDSNYRGYWESRGYSNSGDLKDNFLEK